MNIMNPGKRKIITGAILLITGVVITLIKGDIPPNLNNLLEWLYFAFVLGNGFEHFTNMKVKGNK
jgi:hypothetical protein